MQNNHETSPVQASATLDWDDALEQRPIDGLFCYYYYSCWRFVHKRHCRFLFTFSEPSGRRAAPRRHRLRHGSAVNWSPGRPMVACP